MSSPNCNAADNNGNLRKQETFVPNSDGSSTSWYQQYEYDSLNRLTEVHEHANNSLLWHQSYVYDRYGNRTIDGNGSSDGINKQSFEVETATNRLLATGDSVLSASYPSPRKMRYDAAGNLTNDNWSSYGSASAGAITRTYDAENRMTSALDSSGGTSYYTYNADGQRVRRTVSGQPSAVTTWQIYGLAGELLAEYAASAAPASPQKEYGYRNGQLLITADAPSGSGARINVALAANGGVATASSAFPGYGASSTNNGERKGAANSYWNDAAPANTFPDWLQVDFNGSKTIDEINVFTEQDNWQNPSEPTETLTLSLYGVSGYEVQYWNGSAWMEVSGGNVSGNNKVWRKFIFAAVTTTKIRVLTSSSADGYSRLTEVEAWTARTNVALPGNGGAASASSSYPSTPTEDDSPATANNGDRTGKVGSIPSVRRFLFTC